MQKYIYIHYSINTENPLSKTTFKSTYAGLTANKLTDRYNLFRLVRARAWCSFFSFFLRRKSLGIFFCSLVRQQTMATRLQCIRSVCGGCS